MMESIKVLSHLEKKNLIHLDFNPVSFVVPVIWNKSTACFELYLPNLRETLNI